jgi:hypothetical protein
MRPLTTSTLLLLCCLQTHILSTLALTFTSPNSTTLLSGTSLTDGALTIRWTTGSDGGTDPTNIQLVLIDNDSSSQSILTTSVPLSDGEFAVPADKLLYSGSLQVQAQNAGSVAYPVAESPTFVIEKSSSSPSSSSIITSQSSTAASSSTSSPSSTLSTSAVSTSTSPSTTSDAAPPQKTSSSKLSIQAAASIALGSVIGLSICATASLIFFRRRKAKKARLAKMDNTLIGNSIWDPRQPSQQAGQNHPQQNWTVDYSVPGGIAVARPKEVAELSDHHWLAAVETELQREARMEALKALTEKPQGNLSVDTESYISSPSSSRSASPLSSPTLPRNLRDRDSRYTARTESYPASPQLPSPVQYAQSPISAQMMSPGRFSQQTIQIGYQHRPHQLSQIIETASLTPKSSNPNSRPLSFEPLPRPGVPAAPESVASPLGARSGGAWLEAPHAESPTNVSPQSLRSPQNGFYQHTYRSQAHISDDLDSPSGTPYGMGSRPMTGQMRGPGGLGRIGENGNHPDLRDSIPLPPMPLRVRNYSVSDVADLRGGERGLPRDYV